MKKSKVSIVHIGRTTFINTDDHFISFDRLAGERKQPLYSLCLFYPPEGFVRDLEASKIVVVDTNKTKAYRTDTSEVACTLTMLPQSFYTNSLLEEVLCNLFIKYNL
jgi:hypothetical protein